MTVAYLADIDAEERGWYEIVRLIRALTLDERMRPGYYHDPDWSVRDVVGHVGTWLAEGATQFERIAAGTYTGHADIDIDALNAVFLDALKDQPWDVVWTQANAARTRVRQAWEAIPEPNDEADWWIRKSGVEHYAEHIDRLRDWVMELQAARSGGGG